MPSPGYESGSSEEVVVGVEVVERRMGKAGGRVSR